MSTETPKNVGSPQVPESGPFPSNIVLPYSPPGLERGATDIDTKLAASVYGGAAATLTWTLLAQFVDQVGDMDSTTLATVVGSSSILLGGILGYFTRNR